MTLLETEDGVKAEVATLNVFLITVLIIIPIITMLLNLFGVIKS